MQTGKNIAVWFEIYVDDMDRAKDFYQYVFQIREFINLSKKSFRMYAFDWDDEVEGAGGALVKMDFNKPSTTGTIVYFNCEDCAAVEKRTKEKGGEIIVSKTPLDHFGFSAIIRDSEGNLIGLYSLK
ncbi:VOC family protein [Olivibacter jilunii]|uniref:VOC family protein n=1 Tax=Olivibacter jilunii TaxID=985016 RepID=UPI003F14061E